MQAHTHTHIHTHTQHTHTTHTHMHTHTHTHTHTLTHPENPFSETLSPKTLRNSSKAGGWSSLPNISSSDVWRRRGGRGGEGRGGEGRGEERRREEKRREEKRRGASILLFTDWVYSFYTPGQTSGRRYQTCVSWPSDVRQTSELALVPAG